MSSYGVPSTKFPNYTAFQNKAIVNIFGMCDFGLGQLDKNNTPYLGLLRYISMPWTTDMKHRMKIVAYPLLVVTL